MKRAHDVLTTFGGWVVVLASAATLAGCGGSSTGGPKGVGGATQGTGGVTGIGGSGGATQGTGGATGTGGNGGATGVGGSGSGGATQGTGGSAIGGSKGTGGGAGSGGNLSGAGGRGATGGSGGGAGGNGGGGSGGRTTLASGTGGAGIDGGAGRTGAGGRATGGAGGVATGGTGGTATGGATGLDGGAPDAPLAKCSDVTTQAECDARSDCHSVFEDPGTCGCATPGCCAHFRSCADGDKADCSGPALCTTTAPHCESPYVIAYRNSCYEFCAKQTDCALPACPQTPPANGASCGSLSQTCLYEDCAGAGRTVATCTTRTWQVTTGACNSVYCEPNPDSPYALTCQAGQVCIITTSSGGALIVTPTCVEHSCGTGPISPQCVPSLSGTCTASYSPGGAIFRCQVVVDCGDAACA